MLMITTLQILILAIAWTAPSAYGQTHVIASNGNNNKNNVDL
jgi:hypothetical protein